MHDTDTTNLLPIYVILGARDFFQKKNENRSKVRSDW